MPILGGCTSAALSRGGSESEQRLDRLSARAKQAGLTTKRGVVYQRVRVRRKTGHI